MNEFDWLQQLAARADEQPLPAIDVSQRVVRQLSRQRRPGIVNWPLALVSTCACAASAAAVAFWLIAAQPDPIATLSEAAIRDLSPEAFRQVLLP